MFDEFLEINGIGPFPIYRVWMKRPIREDVRMLQMDRIARARHWLVTQLNASARMTVTERSELRVVRRLARRIEEQLRLLVLTGTTWPGQAEPVRLRWPDVPDAKWERHCHGWGCTKTVPAGRLVCPWCGRFENAFGVGWEDVMDALYAHRKTVYMGNGICKTVAVNEGHGECHRIVEQYTRMSEEALGMEPLELKVEVPVETARAWMEAQGVGDS